MQQHQRRLFRQKPDGDIDPAGEAGWFLQRERERRGESLELASERCAIHPHHLEAIEAGDLTRLPARIEALRMIGAYGAYLGFDPQPLVLHYAQFLPKPGVRPATNRTAAPKPLGSATIISFPLARFGRALSSGSGGIASVVVALGLFGAAVWILPQLSGPGPVEVVAIEDEGVQETRDVAEEDQAAAEVDQAAVEDLFETAADTPVASITTLQETALGDTADTVARAEADRSADGLPGLGDFISSKISAVDEAAFEPRRSTTPGPGGGRVYGSQNADARLVLKANAPVWVRIEDTQGNVILTQTLLAGDSYRVPDRSDLVIIARDGGLLTVEIDGVTKGSLGTPGEILVGRPLDIESLASNG
jgi:cytoskeleton protein RodZ